MLTLPQDLGALLLRGNLVSAEQLAEAQALAARTGLKIGDALVKLCYISDADLLVAIGRFLNLQVINLTDVRIPPPVIDLLPESIARENLVVPLLQRDGTLWVVTFDPLDTELREKLQFILNKNIQFVLAIREQILDAINSYYGEADQESLDELMSEYTDTAIDMSASSFEFTDDELCAATSESQCFEPDGVSAVQWVERQATVRYYDRMNPERLFPLLVVLSSERIREAMQKGVTQERSGPFEVALDSVVEIEPVLPGCNVYPPLAQAVIVPGQTAAKFQVVPHVLGKLEHARVIVRQNGRVLAEVPLEVRVAKQALTVLMGALSLVAPLVSMIFKHFKIDFASQLGLFARIGEWLLAWPPELLAVPFLLGAGGLYAWFRPRQRDVFWDIDPVTPAATGQRPRRQPAASQPAVADHPAALVAQAEKHYDAKQFQAALACYQRAFAHGPAKPKAYHQAALAAAALGDNRRALAILREAESQLDRSKVPGTLWFNMACFATRLGQLPDAIRYIHRAIDAGFRKLEKYRTDPDLEPLRWRSDFRQLLKSLERSA